MSKSKQSIEDDLLQIQQVQTIRLACTSQSRKSELDGVYDKLFQQILAQLTTEKVEQKLYKSGKIYEKSTWKAKIEQTVIKTDYESTTIELHYGKYATKINVFTIIWDCNFQDEAIIGQGQFGTIYRYKDGDETYAVKSIKYTNQFQIYKPRELYQQLFIAILASELEIGPKIVNVFGYDLVLTKSCGIFVMEECYDNFSKRKKNADSQQRNKNLRQGLYSMHCLRILHRDIKPSNICWSPSTKKYVFIDFGLASIAQEQRGYQTYTGFRGSYSFCSPQMKKRFTLQSPGYVDLYYNDAFGLEKSLAQIVEQQNRLKRFAFNQVGNQMSCQFDYSSNSLVYFCEVLNIRKCIFLEGMQACINQIQNCQWSLKSCLQIVKKHIQNKFKTMGHSVQQRWEQIQSILQQKLINRWYITSQIDTQISQIINTSFTSSYFFICMNPFQKMFQQKIESIGNSAQWLKRSFLTIFPLKLSQQFAQKYNKILALNCRIIVAKVYRMLGHQYTTLFIKRLRVILTYFFNEFIKLKNSEYIESIALIFIKIKDYSMAMQIWTEFLKLKSDKVECSIYVIVIYFIFFKNTTNQQFLQLQKKFDLKILEPFLSQQQDQSLIIVYKLAQCIRQVGRLMKTSKDYQKQIQRLVHVLEEAKHKFKKTDIFAIVQYIQKNVQEHFLKAIEFKRLNFNNKDNNLSRKDEKSFYEIKIIRRQIKTQVKYKKYQVFKQFAQILGQILFDELHKSEILLIENFQNFDRAKQICEFYYQISDGNISYDYPDLVKLIIVYGINDKRMAPEVFNNEIRWLRLSKDRKYFQFYYSKMKFFFQIHLVMCFEGQQNWKHSQRYTYIECLQTLLIQIQKRIQQQIQQPDQMIYLQQTITLMRCMNTIFNQKQQKFHQQITQLYEYMLPMKPLKSQGICNKSMLLIVLSTVRNLGIIKNQCLLMDITNKMLNLWNCVDQIIYILQQQCVSEEIIGIEQDRGNYRTVFNMIIKMIKQIAKQDHKINFRVLLSSFYKNVHDFCELTPHYALACILNRLIDSKITTGSYLQIFPSQNTQISYNKNYNLCYLLFWMLMYCHELIKPQRIINILYSVSRIIPSLPCSLRIHILSQYYNLFAKYCNYRFKNRRKSVICLKLMCRSSLKPFQKRYIKLHRMLKNRGQCFQQGSVRHKFMVKVSAINVI